LKIHDGFGDCGVTRNCRWKPACSPFNADLNRAYFLPGVSAERSVFMFSRRNSFSLKLKLAASAIVLVGVVATALSVAQAVRTRSAVIATVNPAQTDLSVQQEERIESELITLRGFGFEPAVIKRPAGDVIFILNNRSNLKDVSLTLTRVQGSRPTDKVKDVGLRKGQVNWVERFNLPPGDYVFTEASRPDWKCSITLTPPRTQ